MLFFDDCTYGDNCANVASHCPGVTCVRTPHGLTEEDFKLGLEAFAAGKKVSSNDAPFKLLSPKTQNPG